MSGEHGQEGPADGAPNTGLTVRARSRDATAGGAERDGENVVELRRQAEETTTGSRVPNPGCVVPPCRRHESAILAECNVRDLPFMLELVHDTTGGELDHRCNTALTTNGHPPAVGARNE